MKLSIIIPVLDEATLLPTFLRHARERIPGVQLIVVDGGSRDGSAKIATPFVDVLVHSPRGRAVQMNAGAAAATGDTFLFLHADSELPEDLAGAITALMSDPTVVGGCFRLRFPKPELIYRVSDSLGNLAVDLFGIALGDHGIFCRRDAFEATGGYPDVPILEDAELYRALGRVGRMRQLRPEIITSPRRYEQLGPWRTTAYYAAILALYVSGTPIDTLHRVYRRLTEPRKATLQESVTSAALATSSR